MDSKITFQAQTAQKPSAGAQKKDSTAAGQRQLHGNHALTKQLPLLSDTKRTTATGPNSPTFRGRGHGRGKLKSRPHEIYQNNQKVFEELFTNKY